MLPVIEPAWVYAVILQGAVIGRRVWFPVNTDYQFSRFLYRGIGYSTHPKLLYSFILASLPCMLSRRTISCHEFGLKSVICLWDSFLHAEACLQLRIFKV